MFKQSFETFLRNQKLDKLWNCETRQMKLERKIGLPLLTFQITHWMNVSKCLYVSIVSKKNIKRFSHWIRIHSRSRLRLRLQSTSWEALQFFEFFSEYFRNVYIWLTKPFDIKIPKYRRHRRIYTKLTHCKPRVFMIINLIWATLFIRNLSIWLIRTSFSL